ncbi:unnamed protein product [Phytophthora lilii]|uniref:Unnamed protein product n=1 Tax=Phytophthora lilii TaxID=2077276 RepID=A0A9W7D9R5_9STRA|nr:unnamed protein product [Phytophthora lilii]
MTYFSGVVPGTASIGSALVLGASGSLTGLAISGNLSFSGSSRSISITGVSSYIDCREYRHNGNTYDLSLLQNISGVSFGTATPNKFLICDSSPNIGGLSSVSATTLSCTNLRQGLTCPGAINGFLAYGNQSAITTVGSLTELGINSTPTNEYFSIKGWGFDYLDGSYTRMLTFSGSNITPVQFQIEVHNGTNSTSRLGLGTTNPSAPLHVPSSNNFVFGAGGTTVYRLRTDSGATESALSPITYSVAGIFGGYIACTAMAMTSDRRLKKSIQPCPIDRLKRLYDSCEVKLYEWNESENKPGQEVGIIAQDLVSAHLTDLTSVFYRDDIEEGGDPSIEPAHAQLNVDYSRIAAYNMKMIQYLLGEIDR